MNVAMFVYLCCSKKNWLERPWVMLNFVEKPKVVLTPPQEQSQAQRELWMMDDILSGLRVNRDNFRVLLGFQRHTGNCQKHSYFV